MAAYAALVSLMNNIEQIQSHIRLPIRFDQTQSEALLEKVSFLTDFLETYNHRGSGEEMKDLESRITGAAYAAEDIIETHVVDRIEAHSKSLKDENERIAHFTAEKNPALTFLRMKCFRLFGLRKKNPTLTCHRSIDRVIEDMDYIMKKAMKLKDMNETEDPRPSKLITSSLISSVPAGSSFMVGFDNELKRIMERLTARERSRQVIPIVGMGGMGKTTLAKTAYEKPFVGKHFDFCAWVTISQEYNLKKIILGLLPNEQSQMSDKELGNKLHKSLFGRRYLVVLDDMWTVEAWEMVKLFLPDNNNGSRIVVTTRESSVSNCFGSSSLQMSFMNEDQSWNLFCEKVFAPKGCPCELEEAGRKIVNSCKGLPLSIVVIGGLLAKSDRSIEYWEHIAQDTKRVINLADNERCMKILSLSYQHLPVHLKPCFLYIGVFPEDEKMHASMLIKLWTAEGFLKSNCSKELKVLGEEYLSDLISRNLIMIDRRGLDGKVKSCIIHDLLRDISLQIAKIENFMYAPNRDEIQFTGSHRRISLHKSILNEENVQQAFETFRSGSTARTLICADKSREVLLLRNFRLMRIF